MRIIAQLIIVREDLDLDLDLYIPLYEKKKNKLVIKHPYYKIFTTGKLDKYFYFFLIFSV